MQLGQPPPHPGSACEGTRGRTAPQRLDRRLEEEEDDADLFGLTRTAYVASDSADTDHFVINTEPVGEILAVSIAVRHRHLTDEWYLRHVLLTDPERTRTRHFPCHNVVLSKATLRPGEGIAATRFGIFPRPRDAMLARVLTLWPCVSVCLSEVGILSKGTDGTAGWATVRLCLASSFIC